MMQNLELKNTLRTLSEETLNLELKEISTAVADASTRTYYRLTFQDTSTILACIHNDTVDPDNDFIIIREQLNRENLNVPKILAVKENIILQEDLGALDLQEALKQDNDIEPYIDKVVDILIQLLQVKLKPPVSERLFDYEKLWFEMSYLMKALDKSPYDGLPPLCVARLQKICRTLATEAKHFAHRDFHSRNIIVKDQDLYLIDFQDARLATPYYDLTSFLYDPYMSLTDESKNKILDRFLNRYKKLYSNFDLTSMKQQALQRVLKAWGTYLHQTYTLKNNRYTENISTAIHSALLLSLDLGYNELVDYLNKIKP